MTISFEGSVEGVGGLSGAGLSGGIAFDTRGNIGLIGTVTAKFGPGVMVGLGRSIPVGAMIVADPSTVLLKPPSRMEDKGSAWIIRDGKLTPL